MQRQTCENGRLFARGEKISTLKYLLALQLRRRPNSTDVGTALCLADCKAEMPLTCQMVAQLIDMEKQLRWAGEGLCRKASSGSELASVFDMGKKVGSS